MTVRNDGIFIARMPVPAVMAPDGESSGLPADPFGADTIELRAVVLLEDDAGTEPADPFFLAGAVEHVGDDGANADQTSPDQPNTRA